MRRSLMSIVLLAMLAALAALLLMRERSAALKPVEKKPAEKTASSDGASGDAGSGMAEIPRDAGPLAVTERPPVPTLDLDRPLRAVGIGWDVLVPGIIANDGLTPGTGSRFAKDGLKVELRAMDSMSEVESALALGGAEKDGADIAVVSLPRLVASYEDLRALKPKMFFVVGWSRGRHALYGTRAADLLELPGRGDVTVVAEKGAPETLLALFLMDLSGIDPRRIKLVDPSAEAAESQPFAALDRTEADDPDRAQSRVLVTTADATGLIPYVAIAPEGFLGEHPEAVAAWARSWLAGVDTIERDVPGAARRVAAQKGAPEPLELLKALGQIEFAGLAENASAAGLSGRGAINLESLFALTWNLWRETAVLTTPTPESAPLSVATVTRLVLTKREVAPPAKSPKPSFDTEVALRLQLSGRSGDDSAIVSKIGTVAGVFLRSGLRIGVDRSESRSEAIVGQASDRFDLPPGRLRADDTIARRRKATIEVLAAP